MGQYRGMLTPEERARITELQDLLIERFIEHRKAVAEGQEERVKTVEAEIDSEPPRDWRRPFLLRRRSDEQSCEEVFP